MSAGVRYPVPAGEVRAEERIRRSRFVTTIARAATPEDAHALVDRVRAEHDGATHHCWAFVAGPPGSTADVGMSDDGEPHGTAGRPILDALLHSGVGEIAAVVIRWFGGVKLGKGGLRRAYAAGVTKALEALPTGERVQRTVVRVAVAYAHRDPVVRAAAELGAVLLDEDYGEDARLRLAVPADRLQDFRSTMAGVTGGTARIEPA